MSTGKRNIILWSLCRKEEKFWNDQSSLEEPQVTDVREQRVVRPFNRRDPLLQVVSHSSGRGSVAGRDNGLHNGDNLPDHHFPNECHQIGDPTKPISQPPDVSYTFPSLVLQESNRSQLKKKIRKKLLNLLRTC